MQNKLKNCYKWKLKMFKFSIVRRIKWILYMKSIACRDFPKNNTFHFQIWSPN